MDILGWRLKGGIKAQFYIRNNGGEHMTIEQIKAMVDGPEYEFFRTNPHLKGKLIFLTLGGSYSYGTNVETSDVDG